MAELSLQPNNPTFKDISLSSLILPAVLKSNDVKGMICYYLYLPVQVSHNSTLHNLPYVVLLIFP